MSIKIIEKYANGVIQACGLDLNQAKTVVYWAIATHAIDKLQIMPILVVTGPPGTGKSWLLKVLAQICKSPVNIDGEVSYAELRDKLKYQTTAIIEEADKISEKLIRNRYSRQTSKTSVKRGSASAGWSSNELDLFGPTAIHRRPPFKDPAVDSRSIKIHTSRKTGPFSMPTLDGLDLAAIAGTVNWNTPLPINDGRVVDTWMPLLQAARDCGDHDWVAYALGQINIASQNLQQGQGYEPDQLVVSKLISLAVDPNIGPLKPRVAIQAISKALKDEGAQLNSWQVGLILRNLGLTVKQSGGTQYVYVDKPQLVAVAAKLGIDDDALK